ncbi:hypothetical protein IDVR_38270 [Intrasporangium sp. DVR]
MRLSPFPDEFVPTQPGIDPARRLPWVTLIALRVKGHLFLPRGGRETCPVTVTRTARWWPWDLLNGWPPLAGSCQLKGLTPAPLRAWVRRTDSESPRVWWRV